jgi:fucose permease
MLTIILAYLAFIALGLSTGFLGVAWPSIRDSFGLPLDAVGILLLAITSGSILASSANGRLVPRFGIGILLIGGALFGTVGQIGIAFAPGWWLVVALGFVSGIGGGIVDSGMNIYVAQHHSARVMNWLHASFGLGATLGPLMMTAVLDADLSWRYGYGVAAAAQFLMVVLFLLTYKQWRASPEAIDEIESGQGNGRASLNLILWLSIILFFLYAGIEVSAGQWSYPLFTEARNIDVKVAGLWVSIYWGIFTIGRLIFGFIVNYVGAVPMLRACMLGIIIGTFGLIARVNTLSFIGLAFVGLVQAPIFPLLISETPKRMGNRLASRAIGYQVGAAGLGIAILPGLAGILADSWSLEIIGPFLLIAAIIMFGLHETILNKSQP